MAIVVPEVNYLLEYCKEAKIEGNFTDLCKNQVSYFILNYICTIVIFQIIIQALKD